MDSNQWQAEQFERNRAHLRAVAQRILGSDAEADDAVQEAWLRLSRSDTAGVENMRGWLTTVVSRICLDMLRARQSRGEELVDEWSREPVVALFEEGEADPEHEALIADGVGLALLVVLDTLSPAERLSFVLHDMFGVPFEEIAPIIERNPTAARQLASRARRRVRGAAEPQAPSLAHQRKVVEAFLAASRDGDFDALVAVLDPDVELRIDGGVLRQKASLILRGSEAVAAYSATYSKLYPFIRPALVNGAAGAVVAPAGRVFSVMAFTVTNGRITQIDALADPERLEQLNLAIPPSGERR